MKRYMSQVHITCNRLRSEQSDQEEYDLLSSSAAKGFTGSEVNLSRDSLIDETAVVVVGRCVGDREPWSSNGPCMV